MGVRRVLPADSGTAIGKIYPQDKHSRGYPGHAQKAPAEPWDGNSVIKPLRNTEGGPIERLKPGDDPRAAIGRLYSEGRTYPHGKPHEYRAREVTPKFKGIAPDQSQPEFKEERAVHLNNTREAWQRGMGSESPYPRFDSGPSGHRYDKK
jgi:hypothetical protein